MAGEVQTGSVQTEVVRQEPDSPAAQGVGVNDLPTGANLDYPASQLPTGQGVDPSAAPAPAEVPAAPAASPAPAAAPEGVVPRLRLNVLAERNRALAEENARLRATIPMTPAQGAPQNPQLDPATFWQNPANVLNGLHADAVQQGQMAAKHEAAKMFLLSQPEANEDPDFQSNMDMYLQQYGYPWRPDKTEAAVLAYQHYRQDWNEFKQTQAHPGAGAPPPTPAARAVDKQAVMRLAGGGGGQTSGPVTDVDVARMKDDEYEAFRRRPRDQGGLGLTD